MTAPGALDDAWERWTAVLRGHGWGIDAVLREPADPAALTEAVRAVGMPLPRQVVGLLLLADGQHELRTAGGRSAEPVTNVFPGAEFLSVERAVRVWEGWRDIRAQYGPEGLARNFDDMITVRHGDAVHAVYTRAAWWPFAEDGGGNALWVDTDPPPGGTVGQVLVAGPDEDERRVLAPDLATYLERLAAAQLDPPDPDALADGIAWWDAPHLR